MRSLHKTTLIMVAFALAACGPSRPTPPEPLAFLPELRAYDRVSTLGSDDTLVMTSPEGDRGCRVDVARLSAKDGGKTSIELRTLLSLDSTCLTVFATATDVWVVSRDLSAGGSSLTRLRADHDGPAPSPAAVSPSIASWPSM